MTRKTPSRIKPPQVYVYAGDTAAQLKTTCPACGAAIMVQAKVDKFLEPPDWLFWGYKDARWVRCRGESDGRPYIHFWTIINGNRSDRLAWINPTPDDAPAQKTLFEVNP